MLKKCIKMENMKLKHSCIWLACILIPVIPAIMGTFNLLQNLGILNKDWYSLWTQMSLFYSNFFYAPLIALYGAYLWRVEHRNHNWNILKSCPVPLADIYWAKFAVIVKVTLLTQCWLGVLFFAGGKLAGIPGMIPEEIVFWIFRGTLAGFAIGSLQLLLSFKISSFSVSIGIALLGSVMGFILLNKDLGLYWPYSLMLLGMNSNRESDAMANASLSFFVSTALFFLGFSLINIYALKKKE